MTTWVPVAADRPGAYKIEWGHPKLYPMPPYHDFVHAKIRRKILRYYLKPGHSPPLQITLTKRRSKLVGTITGISTEASTTHGELRDVFTNEIPVQRNDLDYAYITDAWMSQIELSFKDLTTTDNSIYWRHVGPNQGPVPPLTREQADQLYMNVQRKHKTLPDTMILMRYFRMEDDPNGLGILYYIHGEIESFEEELRTWGKSSPYDHTTCEVALWNQVAENLHPAIYINWNGEHEFLSIRPALVVEQNREKREVQLLTCAQMKVLNSACEGGLVTPDVKGNLLVWIAREQNTHQLNNDDKALYAVVRRPKEGRIKLWTQGGVAIVPFSMSDVDDGEHENRQAYEDVWYETLVESGQVNMLVLYEESTEWNRPSVWTVMTRLEGMKGIGIAIDERADDIAKNSVVVMLSRNRSKGDRIDVEKSPEPAEGGPQYMSGGRRFTGSFSRRPSSRRGRGGRGGGGGGGGQRLVFG